ncbi:addiction module protein [Thiohalocapsa sp. ML1]|jgi:putative addiction module component (TIGR02574 family)|uniref:addiction module protein n=1 Tax=Thiohalocapsa sp. ML1 TaxID=1431688 RepID=UPI00073226C4|nr:addiction module protein [Thiohalocapsa sp. ML1]
MQTRQLIDEARSLSLKEKLLFVEKIWGSSAAEGDAPPLSSWQEAELDRREQLFGEGTEQLHAADEVHAKLRKRR